MPELTPELQFCIWLRGSLEYKAVYSTLTPEELTIQDHLDLVFTKVTPDRSRGTSPKPITAPPEAVGEQEAAKKSPKKPIKPSSGAEEGGNGGVDWAKILEDAKKLKPGPVPYDPNPGPYYWRPQYFTVECSERKKIC